MGSYEQYSVELYILYTKKILFTFILNLNKKYKLLQANHDCGIIYNLFSFVFINKIKKCYMYNFF